MWFGPRHFENAKRCFLCEKQKCWREKTSQFPVMSQLYYELIDKIWSSSQWWSSDVAQYDQLHQFLSSGPLCLFIFPFSSYCSPCYHITWNWVRNKLMMSFSSFSESFVHCSCAHYHPHMRVGNAFGHICLCVCLCLCVCVSVCVSVCLRFYLFRL